MYYNGARIFIITFFVSLFTSVAVCLVFFFLLPISPIKKSGGEVVVPDVRGSTVEQSRVIAESRSLLLIVGGEEENDKYPENIICRQTPLPGSTVQPKSTITVFISKGSSQITVPNLKGEGLSEATVRLSEFGLKIGEIKTEESTDIEKDKIISTVPPAGTKIKKDDMITIILSRGVEIAEVPRLIGRALSTAKRIIEEHGFVIGNISYEVSTEYNVGIVMGQYPRAGTKIKKGARIDIVVATVLE